MRIVALLLFALSLTAEELVLDNQTAHPQAPSKMAIQWASSAREVDEANHATLQGLPLNPKTLRHLSPMSKTKIEIPKKAEYFRVLLWSKGQKEADFLTNWVHVVPDKTYTLHPKHLIPAVLAPGSGC